MTTSNKPRLATVWLDGCSGCHMSFLDLDERLIEVGELADLVYSPLIDFKDYPDEVDVCLVEGAVSSEEDFHKIQMIREHTKVLVSFGDCAVTANVPAMRNPFKVKEVLERGYFDNATLNHSVPDQVIPKLRDKVIPVHQVVHVDCFLPGCPPHADLIYQAVVSLLQGNIPDTAGLARFGK